MADLSKTTVRGTTAGRITDNRDRLVQTARTELENVRPQADQRDAAVGDARADDIRRSLGMLNQAGQTVGGYFMDKSNKADAASGSADGLTGAMNPELAKHKAYADAYHGANAVASSIRWQAETGEALQQLADDPTKSPADIEAEFQTRTAAYVQDFKERYSNSPEAQATAAKSLVQWTAEFQPKLHKIVKDRTDEQMLTDTTTVVAADIHAGRAVDYTGIETRLAATGVDRTKIRDHLFQTAMIAATDPASPSPEVAAEASKAMRPAADGHPAQPFFSPEQISQLRNAQIQADALHDKKEKDDQKLAITTFEADVIKSGDRNFLPNLIKLRDGGKITVEQFNETAGTLNRAFNTVEDGYVDEKALLDLKRMMIVPNPNWSAVQTAARKANLGTGTAAESARLSVLLDAAQGIRSDQARAEARANARAGQPKMSFTDANNYQSGSAIFASAAPDKTASVGEITAYYQAFANFRNKAEANPSANHVKDATEALAEFDKTRKVLSSTSRYQQGLNGTVTPAGKTQAVTPGDMRSFLAPSTTSTKPPATAMVYDRNGNRIQ